MDLEETCKCNKVYELEKARLVITELEDANARIQSNLEAILIEEDKNKSLLQQQKHDLELKLSRQMMMSVSYQDDLEAIQREFATEKKNAVKEAESKMSEQVGKLKLDLSNLEGDLERSKVSEVELRQENERLVAVVERLKVQLKEKEVEKVPNESFSNGSFSEEIDALKKENSILSEENCHLRSRSDQMERKMIGWKEEVAQKDVEISKLAYESVSYFNENERLKEKIKDLQVEIDVMTMQSNKRVAKGNSLFAEVEDRRVEVEKELCGMRSENNLLKQKLKKTTEDLKIIKMQQMVKWDVVSSREYKERLDSILAQNKNLLDDNKILGYKLKAVEAEEEILKSKFLNQGRSVDSEARRYQILFESNEQKLKELRGNYDKKSITLCMMESRLRKAESDLSMTKQELFGIFSENEKLKMKVEELINKYEPEKHEPPPKPKKMEFHKEKLNFSSRKKFHLDSKADAIPTTGETLSEDLHQQVASDLSSITSINTNKLKMSERFFSENKPASNQETILQESLNCTNVVPPSQHHEITSSTDEITEIKKNSQKVPLKTKATLEDQSINPAGNYTTTCLEKENTKGQEVIPVSNDGGKVKDESNEKVLSLQDELAAFNVPEMKSDVISHGGSGDDDNITEVLQKSSKVDVKEVASNSAPTCQPTKKVQPSINQSINSSTGRKCDSKESENACKTQ